MLLLKAQKARLESSYFLMSLGKLASALRELYFFCYREEGIEEERRRQGRWRSTAFETHSCIRRRDYSRTLYGVPGKPVPASVLCHPVCRPLAAFACAYRVQWWLGGLLFCGAQVRNS